MVVDQPEVGEPRATLAVDQDVRRLDVAVHQPGRVRRRQRLGDLRRDRQRLVGRQRTGGDPAVEPLAVHQLHREVVEPRGLARRDHAHDAGVVEPRDRARLAGEALDLLGVERRRGGQHLERDPPAERLLDRLVDDPHPAAPDLAHDDELAQPAAAGMD